MGDSKMMDRCCTSLRETFSDRVGIASFLLGGVLLSLVALALGCSDAENKKAALTPEEIERLTYAPKPVRPGTLLVSGETLTCEDVMTSPAEPNATAFKDQLEQLARSTTLEQYLALARPRTRQRLDSRITSIVLYKRAQHELGEKVDETLDAVAEKELRRFVLEHGGNNAQADEALRALGMNRASYKEFKKRQLLAQYAVSSKMPKNSPITFSEMMAAYNEMKDDVFVKPGMIEFRLIDIQVSRMALTEPNDPVQAARVLAESLVTRICAGGDFAKLAEEYSDGFRREYGGLWEARDPESLAEPYDVLPKYAEKIDPGQIAGPIAAPGHFFILKLEAKREKGYLPLAEVQDKVEERIRTDRRLEALGELDAEVAQQTAGADTESFLDECLERLYRTANANGSPAAP